jgi:hypothetical protein
MSDSMCIVALSADTASLYYASSLSLRELLQTTSTAYHSYHATPAPRLRDELLLRETVMRRSCLGLVPHNTPLTNYNCYERRGALMYFTTGMEA